ncbi:MAG: hypothetical protein KDE14_07465, partial [Rhodobacteraceae bacterium]|nr:hypothetical protein [Paracoccaceae bacterium]
MSGSNNAVAALSFVVAAVSGLPGLAQVSDVPEPPPPAPVVLVPSASGGNSQAGGFSDPTAIAVDNLRDLGIDRIGLMDEFSGGLPASMWAASDPDFVRFALANLPTRVHARAMRTLSRRLLLPGAAPPTRQDYFSTAGSMFGATPLPVLPAGSDSTVDGETATDESSANWLFEARLDALTAQGAWSDAVALVTLVPVDRQSEKYFKVRADTALVDGNVDAACTEASAGLARTADPYWQKLQVFCQFSAGQNSAAQLGLTLLREQAVQDDEFYWAAELLQGNRPLTPNGLRTLAPLPLAMLKFAGRPLPDGVLRYGDPTALRVAAQMKPAEPDDEKLTDEERAARMKSALEAQIVLAERAIEVGSLDPQVLRDLYAAVDFSQDPEPPQLTQITPGNVRGRAFIYQLAASQTVPTAR